MYVDIETKLSYEKTVDWFGQKSTCKKACRRTIEEKTEQSSFR